MFSPPKSTFPTVGDDEEGIQLTHHKVLKLVHQTVDDGTDDVLLLQVPQSSPDDDALASIDILKEQKTTLCTAAHVEVGSSSWSDILRKRRVVGRSSSSLCNKQRRLRSSVDEQATQQSVLPGLFVLRTVLLLQYCKLGNTLRGGVPHHPTMSWDTNNPTPEIDRPARFPTSLAMDGMMMSSQQSSQKSMLQMLHPVAAAALFCLHDWCMYSTFTAYTSHRTDLLHLDIYM